MHSIFHLPKFQTASAHMAEQVWLPIRMRILYPSFMQCYLTLPQNYNDVLITFRMTLVFIPASGGIHSTTRTSIKGVAPSPTSSILNSGLWQGLPQLCADNMEFAASVIRRSPIHTLFPKRTNASSNPGSTVTCISVHGYICNIYELNFDSQICIPYIVSWNIFKKFFSFRERSRWKTNSI